MMDIHPRAPGSNFRLSVPRNFLRNYRLPLRAALQKFSMKGICCKFCQRGGDRVSECESARNVGETARKVAI